MGSHISWTDGEDQMLIRCGQDGMNVFDVMERTGRSYSSINSRSKKLGVQLARVNRQTMDRKHSRKSRPPIPYDDSVSIRAQRQSMLHLLDLKQAGHSPTRTELHLMRIHAEAAQ